MNRFIYKNESGMTLIEVLVAFAIASILILGVFEVFIAQKNLFLSTDITASAQDNARIAIDTISRDLQHAGFGIDPGLAFVLIDLNTYTPTGTFDRTDGPDTLQFFARERNPLPGANEAGCPANPSDVSRRFYWSISNVSTAGFMIHACPGFELHRGTFLLAMCNDGGTYSLLRYNGSNIGNINAETNIPISSAEILPVYSVTDRAYPLILGSSNLSNPCYSSDAQLFRINVYRYYIRPPQVDPVRGIEIVPPYLMLDHGIDLNGDGNFSEDDHIPVAEGIEDLQVVYTFFNGNCAGNPTCTYNDVENISDYTDVRFPSYCDDLYSDETCNSGGTGVSERGNDRLGNTVAVRVSIVARTAIPEPVSGTSGAGGQGGYIPLNVENHIISPPVPVDRFKRILFQTTVPILNTLAGQSFPYL